jgi:hypothetical protein
MASWWRQYAEAKGLTAGSGSWERRVAVNTATSLGATLAPGGSWAKQLGLIVNTAGSPGLGLGGSWTKRIADEDYVGTGSAGRMLVTAGGRAPLT